MITASDHRIFFRSPRPWPELHADRWIGRFDPIQVSSSRQQQSWMALMQQQASRQPVLLLPQQDVISVMCLVAAPLIGAVAFNHLK